MLTLHVDGMHAMRLEPARTYEVSEEKRYSLHGLAPGAVVRVREAGDMRWVHEVIADERGQVLDAHVALGTHERGGDTFDIDVGGTSLSMNVLFSHKFDRGLIESMLQDLYAAGFQWDRSSPIPTRTGDLEEHVEAFCRALDGLDKTVASIVAAPDMILEPVTVEVQPHEVRRVSATLLARELARGRISASGQPQAHRMLSIAHAPSLDTGGNAFVAAVIRELRDILSALLRDVEAESNRIAALAARERRYGYDSLDSAHFQRLEMRLWALRERLLALHVPRLSSEWISLSRSPDGSANVVVFDVRYRTIRDRRLRLRAMRGTDVERLHRLVEFGKRPHDRIYEMWVVAKVLEALQKLGFEGGTEGSRESPLRALEVGASDGEYSLARERPLPLRHHALPHLAVVLAYEQRIAKPSGEKELCPDITIALRDAISLGPPTYGERAYDQRTLFIDAKFRDMRVGSESSELARKYADLRAGAQCHILHVGSYTGWSRRTATHGHGEWVGHEQYFPYRLSWSTLRPSDDPEAARAMSQSLVRIIYSWLVRLGVVCICPRCGGQLAALGSSPTAGVDLALIPFRSYKKRTLVCGKCNLGITANFCGQCRQRNIFTPIVKVYPRADRSNGEVTDDWSLDYEIAVRAGDYRGRVCPRCGAA